MIWLLQTNIAQDDKFDQIVDVLDKNNIEYKFVQTIPFFDAVIEDGVDINQYNEDNIPHLSLDGKDSCIMTIGSYTLAKVAKEKEWEPTKSLVSDNFNINNLKDKYGKHNLLNGESIEGNMKNISIPDDKDWDYFFARPLEDTKSFSGEVFTREEFNDFSRNIVDINEKDLNGDTPIIISPVKEILSEYRLFVIDGVIVTGSMYRVLDTTRSVLIPLNEDERNREEVECLEFANEMLNIYQPERAFVLDVAMTPFGGKIIEINNINSSGFYEADIESIIISLNEMYKNGEQNE